MSEENSLNLEGITGFLGVQAENFDGFKEAFESTYIRRENVTQDESITSQIIGRRMGSLDTAINRTFKNAGLELDTEGKKVEEIIEMGVSAIQDRYKDQISKLEDEGLKNSDEALIEARKLQEKWENKYKEEKALRESTANEFSAYKEESANRIRQNTIGSFVEQAYNRATFREGITELESKGFKDIIKESYKFDLDENNTLVVTDVEGKRIPNEKISGTFMSFDDVIMQESIKHKLYPINDKGGSKVSSPTLKEVDRTQGNTRRVNTAYRG